MNRRGFIGDVAFWMVFLFIFVFTAVIVFIVIDEIETTVDADPDVVQKAKDEIDNIADPYPLWVDSTVMLLFVGAALLLFFSVFFVADFPGLFILVWIFMGILLVIAAALANGYEEFVADTTVAAAEANFTFIPFLMDIYPIAIMLWGVALVLGLYAKSRL